MTSSAGAIWRRWSRRFVRRRHSRRQTGHGQRVHHEGRRGDRSGQGGPRVLRRRRPTGGIHLAGGPAAAASGYPGGHLTRDRGPCPRRGVRAVLQLHPHAGRQLLPLPSSLAYHRDQLPPGIHTILSGQQLRGPRAGGDVERHQRPVAVRGSFAKFSGAQTRSCGLSRWKVVEPQNISIAFGKGICHNGGVMDPYAVQSLTVTSSQPSCNGRKRRMTRRTVVGCEELSFATSVAVAPDDDCAPRYHVRIGERLIHPKEDTYLSAVGGKRGRAGSPEIECT